MQSSRISRRTLIKSATVLSIAGSVGGFEHTTLARAPGPRTFMIDHDPSVRVSFTSGEEFEVTVQDADGEVLENHTKLTVSDLFAQPSELFTVSAAPVPGAA